MDKYFYSFIDHLIISFKNIARLPFSTKTHNSGEDYVFSVKKRFPKIQSYWVNISFSGLINGDYYLSINPKDWNKEISEVFGLQDVDEELIGSTFKEVLNAACGSAIKVINLDYPDLTLSPPKIIDGTIDYPKMTVYQGEVWSSEKKIDVFLCLDLMEQSLGKRVKEKSQNIKTIMENIQQGIFTILPNLRIHGEYSHFLEDILEKKNLDKLDIIPLLFEGSNLPPDVVSTIEQSLKIMFGEDIINYEVNKEILPQDIIKKFPGKRKKALHFDWKPIVNKHSVVDRVMVAIRDETELEKLRLEREEKNEELQTINQILKISIFQFQQFLDNSKDRISAILEKFEEKKSDGIEISDVDNFLRSLHTIKGNARTYKLSKVVNFIHASEQKFSDAEVDDLKKVRYEAMACLVELESLLLSAEKKFSYLIKSYEYSRGQKSKYIYIQTDEYVALLNELKKVDLNLYKKFQVSLESSSSKDVREALRPAIENLTSLAEELKKEVPQVHFENGNICIPEKYEFLLLDVVTHLTRNSIYHGFSAGADRQKEGKSKQGNIFFRFSKQKKAISLNYSDDGRGLDIEKLKSKLNLKGKTNQEIADHLLLHGGSSVDSRNLISGSGLGLSAVHSFIEEIGGSISIQLNNNPKSSKKSHHQPFEVLLSIPNK